MLVAFASIDGAAEAVSAVIRGKIIPTTLEFMDGSAIDCVRKAPPSICPGLPGGADH